MYIGIYATGSTGNAYKVSDGTTSVLLDCGISFNALKKACNFTLHAFSGCLVTHCHCDHIKAATELLKAAVPCYMSAGTAEAANLSGHRLKIIKALKQFTVGTFNVLPFDVQHDAPEPLGFLLESTVTHEKVLYFTDTYYLKYKFEGLTHIIGECNFADDIVKENIESGKLDAGALYRLEHSHMSLRHFKEFLQANDLSQVKQIYLVHTSSRNGDKSRFKREVQEMTGKEVYI